MVSSGSQQERNLDGSPGKPNPVFKPTPMQGWSPDSSRSSQQTPSTPA